VTGYGPGHEPITSSNANPGRFKEQSSVVAPEPHPQFLYNRDRSLYQQDRTQYAAPVPHNGAPLPTENLSVPGPVSAPVDKTSFPSNSHQYYASTPYNENSHSSSGHINQRSNGFVSPAAAFYNNEMGPTVMHMVPMPAPYYSVGWMRPWDMSTSSPTPPWRFSTDMAHPSAAEYYPCYPHPTAMYYPSPTPSDTHLHPSTPHMFFAAPSDYEYLPSHQYAVPIMMIPSPYTTYQNPYYANEVPYEPSNRTTANRSQAPPLTTPPSLIVTPAEPSAPSQSSDQRNSLATTDKDSSPAHFVTSEDRPSTTLHATLRTPPARSLSIVRGGTHCGSISGTKFNGSAGAIVPVSPPTQPRLEDEAASRRPTTHLKRRASDDFEARCLGTVSVMTPEGVEETEDAFTTAGETRRRRQYLTAGQRSTGLTAERINQCFHLPIREAAVKLNIGVTVLKRVCRRLGINRWPHRKIARIERWKRAALQMVESKNFADFEELERECRTLRELQSDDILHDDSKIGTSITSIRKILCKAVEQETGGKVAAMGSERETVLDVSTPSSTPSSSSSSFQPPSTPSVGLHHEVSQAPSQISSTPAAMCLKVVQASPSAPSAPLTHAPRSRAVPVHDAIAYSNGSHAVPLPSSAAPGYDPSAHGRSSSSSSSKGHLPSSSTTSSVAPPMSERPKSFYQENQHSYASHPHHSTTNSFVASPSSSPSLAPPMSEKTIISFSQEKKQHRHATHPHHSTTNSAVSVASLPPPATVPSFSSSSSIHSPSHPAPLPLAPMCSHLRQVPSFTPSHMHHPSALSPLNSGAAASTSTPPRSLPSAVPSRASSAETPRPSGDFQYLQPNYIMMHRAVTDTDGEYLDWLQ